ncbi:hypothetical protein [Salegentibacter mishustinae]|jgi:hypothetical protein|nr:hypothetical protein [Salegentibacter mishustinae]PZX66533.1 hypothetical protein LY54_00931 [Salegentibacter mishustinae]
MKKNNLFINLIVSASYPLFAQIGGIEDSVADIADTLGAYFMGINIR